MLSSFASIRIISFLILINFYLSNATFLGRSKRTTKSLIKGYGYPFEEYKVRTIDDYILKLFRIPFRSGASVISPKPRPVAFLVHGFGHSSGDWVLSGSPRSLGLLLADKGYDVWLGNVRGTRYSRKNTRFTPSDQEFWRFSWHEMGLYDLPASIEFIRRKTSTKKIHYIGHSQGTTAFLVAASSVNDFNEYIQTAHLLTPVAFLSQATSPIIRLLAPVLGQANVLAAIGDFEIMPNTRAVEILSNIFCKTESLANGICMNIAELAYGFSSEFTNSTALQILFEMIPNGASIRQLVHYLQLYNSAKFRQYDYGLNLNLKYYQQITPPEYQLKKIKAPTFLYYSQMDSLADPRDVNLLARLLLPTTLKKSYKIPLENWNHVDFIVGNDVDKVLYEILLSDLRTV